MRDYAIVSSRFWTGHTGRQIRALGPRAQVVAVYLLTGPCSNSIGMYYMPLPTLCHETGCPIEGASEILDKLSELGFAHYDHEQEVVWVCEMARFQLGDVVTTSDRKHSRVVKDVATYSRCRFFDAFMARYAEPFNLAPSKPLRSPFEAPSKPLARGPRADQEQEQDQEQEHSPRVRTRERRSEVQAEDEGFEKGFWPAYPNKKAKRAARAAWDKAKKENRLPPLSELLARLEKLKSSREWQKDGGAYIPHPATWINADGWHDEPAAAPTPTPSALTPPAPALRMRPEILELPNGRRVWQCRAPDGTIVSRAGWVPRWGPWPMCAANWPAEWGAYPGDEPPQQDAEPPPVAGRAIPSSTLFDLEAQAS